ncbi:MAG: hypothetical protein M4579_003829 [Chaenotheca gracillima]|nr:MAG: hypothetical protein M4579_003829 [Chaenotheca gracillima]
MLLQIWVLPLADPPAVDLPTPLPGKAPLGSRTFLESCPEDISLQELCVRLCARHNKNYPNQPALQVKKLQDYNDLDLDLEYVVGDVFKDRDSPNPLSSIVKIFQAPTLRESSVPPQSALSPRQLGSAGSKRARRHPARNQGLSSLREEVPQHSSSQSGSASEGSRPSKRQRVQKGLTSASKVPDPDKPVPSREISVEGTGQGHRAGLETGHSSVIEDSQRSQHADGDVSMSSTDDLDVLEKPVETSVHRKSPVLLSIPDSPILSSRFVPSTSSSGSTTDDDSLTSSEVSSSEKGSNGKPSFEAGDGIQGQAAKPSKETSPNLERKKETPIPPPVKDPGKSHLSYPQQAPNTSPYAPANRMSGTATSKTSSTSRAETHKLASRSLSGNVYDEILNEPDSEDSSSNWQTSKKQKLASNVTQSNIPSGSNKAPQSANSNSPENKKDMSGSHETAKSDLNAHASHKQPNINSQPDADKSEQTQETNQTTPNRSGRRRALKAQKAALSSQEDIREAGQTQNEAEPLNLPTRARGTTRDEKTKKPSTIHPNASSQSLTEAKSTSSSLVPTPGRPISDGSAERGSGEATAEGHRKIGEVSTLEPNSFQMPATKPSVAKVGDRFQKSDNLGTPSRPTVPKLGRSTTPLIPSRSISRDQSSSAVKSPDVSLDAQVPLPKERKHRAVSFADDIPPSAERLSSLNPADIRYTVSTTNMVPHKIDYAAHTLKYDSPIPPPRARAANDSSNSPTYCQKEETPNRKETPVYPPGYGKQVQTSTITPRAPSPAKSTPLTKARAPVKARTPAKPRASAKPQASKLSDAEDRENKSSSAASSASKGVSGPVNAKVKKPAKILKKRPRKGGSPVTSSGSSSSSSESSHEEPEAKNEVPKVPNKANLNHQPPQKDDEKPPIIAENSRIGNGNSRSNSISSSAVTSQSSSRTREATTGGPAQFIPPSESRSISAASTGTRSRSASSFVTDDSQKDQQQPRKTSSLSKTALARPYPANTKYTPIVPSASLLRNSSSAAPTPLSNGQAGQKASTNKTDKAQPKSKTKAKDAVGTTRPAPKPAPAPRATRTPAQGSSQLLSLTEMKARNQQAAPVTTPSKPSKLSVAAQKSFAKDKNPGSDDSEDEEETSSEETESDSSSGSEDDDTAPRGKARPKSGAAINSPVTPRASGKSGGNLVANRISRLMGNFFSSSQ